MIGVTGDGKYVTVGEEPRPFMFLPFAQHYAGRMVLHVRTPAGMASLMPALREQLRALDPDVASSWPRRSRKSSGSLFPQRFAGVMVGGLGLLGLLLAAVGTWGVLMYSVSQRIRDFGIRIALGASSADVSRGVLRHGLTLAVTGVALGLVGAALLGGVMRGFLFGIGPHDPATYLAVPAVLIASALAASWQPVRRALRADPVQTLRAD